jgi:hypothetical protein
MDINKAIAQIRLEDSKPRIEFVEPKFVDPRIFETMSRDDVEADPILNLYLNQTFKVKINGYLYIDLIYIPVFISDVSHADLFRYCSDYDYVFSDYGRVNNNFYLSNIELLNNLSGYMGYVCVLAYKLPFGSLRHIDYLNVPLSKFLAMKKKESFPSLEWQSVEIEPNERTVNLEKAGVPEYFTNNLSESVHYLNVTKIWIPQTQPSSYFVDDTSDLVQWLQRRWDYLRDSSATAFNEILGTLWTDQFGDPANDPIWLLLKLAYLTITQKSPGDIGSSGRIRDSFSMDIRENGLYYKTYDSYINTVVDVTLVETKGTQSTYDIKISADFYVGYGKDHDFIFTQVITSSSTFITLRVSADTASFECIVGSVLDSSINTIFSSQSPAVAADNFPTQNTLDFSSGIRFILYLNNDVTFDELEAYKQRGDKSLGLIYSVVQFKNPAYVAPVELSSDYVRKTVQAFEKNVPEEVFYLYKSDYSLWNLPDSYLTRLMGYCFKGMSSNVKVAPRDTTFAFVEIEVGAGKFLTEGDSIEILRPVDYAKINDTYPNASQMAMLKNARMVWSIDNTQNSNVLYCCCLVALRKQMGLDIADANQALLPEQTGVLVREGSNNEYSIEALDTKKGGEK